MSTDGVHSVEWLISIVSHGHGDRLLGVLADVHRHLAGDSYHVVLTLNIEEPAQFLSLAQLLHGERLTIIRNSAPKGFAANHNFAIKGRLAQQVLIADPCLRIPNNIFSALQIALESVSVGIVAPQAYKPNGTMDDNARALVTPFSLVRHHLLKVPREYNHHGSQPICVDWLAGMCLAIKHELFLALNGFDESYFLYCEDVDLCLRVRRAGRSVQLLPELQVIHAANRDSRRHWKHFRMHVMSLLKLWRSQIYKWARYPKP